MQQLTIVASNIADLLSLGYTKIEVWWAPDINTPFSEITRSSAQAAQLVSNQAQTTFDMGGKTLKFSINGGAEQSVSFSSQLKYWTPTQVANQINLVVPGLATVVSNSVVLTSPTTGRGSTVLVTYFERPINDNVSLGWTAGSSAIGLDARITLSSGVRIYTYSDLAGNSKSLYKWRFSANGANPVSEFSKVQQGSPPPVAGLPLSIATATFADASGRPAKRRVLIAAENSPESVGGVVVGSESALVVDSDENGFFQVTLVQGTRVRVAIEGTSFVRQITVPATATFDLLAAMAAAPDTFTIQTTPPLLIRRSI